MGLGDNPGRIGGDPLSRVMSGHPLCDRQSGEKPCTIAGYSVSPIEQSAEHLLFCIANPGGEVGESFRHTIIDTPKASAHRYYFRLSRCFRKHCFN
jgi:hypothetical protein